MATVYVRADLGREFLRLFGEWQRETTRPSIYMLPPEGPPHGEEKQFVMVPEEFLAFLRQKGLVFRVV
jgi:hypothetical protein